MVSPSCPCAPSAPLSKFWGLCEFEFQVLTSLLQPPLLYLQHWEEALSACHELSCKEAPGNCRCQGAIDGHACCGRSQQVIACTSPPSPSLQHSWGMGLLHCLQGETQNSQGFSASGFHRAWASLYPAAHPWRDLVSWTWNDL